MKYLQSAAMATLTLLLAAILVSCNAGDAQLTKNIAMYETTWDKVMNKGMLDEINDTNFTTDVVAVTDQGEIKGLDGFRGYYGAFLTGFSDINFTIIDAFGQGDKLVKHWRFTGKHTGDFAGIPAVCRY